MSLPATYPASTTDQRLNAWMAQRSRLWWKTHWPLALCQTTVVATLAVVSQPIHDFISKPPAALGLWLGHHGLGPSWHLIAVYLTSTLALALPVAAALDWLHSIGPDATLLAELDPRRVERRLLSAGRLVFLLWVSLGALFAVRVGSFLTGAWTHHDASWLIEIPFILGSGVARCFLFQEVALALAQLPWRRWMVWAVTLAAAMPIEVLLLRWHLVTDRIINAHIDYNGPPPSPLAGLTLALVQMLLLLLPALVVFAANQYFSARPLFGWPTTPAAPATPAA